MLKELITLLNLVTFVWLLVLFVSVMKCTLCPFEKFANLKKALLSLVGFSCIFAGNVFLTLLFSDNLRISGFFLRLLWSASFCVASYFYIVNILTKRNKSFLVIIQYLVAGIIALSAFSPYGIKEVFSVYPTVRQSGFMDVFFRIWIILTMLYSIYLSIKFYFFEAEDSEKEYFKYFMYGVGWYIVIGIIGGGILPLLGVMRTITYFIPTGAVVWIIFIMFCVKRQTLLPLEKFYYEILFNSILLGVALLLNHLIFNLLVKILKIPVSISSNFTIVMVFLLLFATPLASYIKRVLEEIILGKKLKCQNLIQQTAKLIVEILDINKLLKITLENIATTFNIKKIAVFLVEEKKDESEEDFLYKLAGLYGIDRLEYTHFKNYKIINWLRENKEPFMVDIASHTLSKEQIKEFTDGLNVFGTVCIVPILYSEHLIGFIIMDNVKQDGSILDIEEIETIYYLADQLAVSIRNSYLYKELDTSYLQIIRALSLALESKETYLIGHTDDVVKYASILAKEMNLSEKEQFIITQAAILHDLGKISVHDYILSKSGELTEKEWAEIKMHPIKGAKILEPLPYLRDVAQIVKSHHEHYDGSGYPEGLRGEQIPLGARILAIADAVDSMLSERPYRRKKSLDEVVADLKSNKGKHFDPVLVEKFLKIIRENPEIFVHSNNTVRNG